MLRSYLKAEGTDKYWVLYSVTEVEGSEHEGDVIVATSNGWKAAGRGRPVETDSTAETRSRSAGCETCSAITLKSAE